MTMQKQRVLAETVGPESVERLTDAKAPLPLRDALRGVMLLEERGAIFDVLADQTERLFYGDLGKAPQYVIERRDGSASPANFNLVVDVAIELRKMGRQARERAAAILSSPVYGFELGDLDDIFPEEGDDESPQEDKPAVGVQNFEAAKHRHADSVAGGQSSRSSTASTRQP